MEKNINELSKLLIEKAILDIEINKLKALVFVDLEQKKLSSVKNDKYVFVLTPIKTTKKANLKLVLDKLQVDFSIPEEAVVKATELNTKTTYSKPYLAVRPVKAKAKN